MLLWVGVCFDLVCFGLVVLLWYLLVFCGFGGLFLLFGLCFTLITRFELWLLVIACAYDDAFNASFVVVLWYCLLWISLVCFVRFVLTCCVLVVLRFVVLLICWFSCLCLLSWVIWW